jgi:hypothetical protein
MQHASSAVFQHNYLSHYVTQDTQAAYRGLEPQTAIIRVASGMSRSIDPLRPRTLSKRQLATVDRRPEVVLARRRRDGLAQRVRAQYTTISRARGTAVYDTYREAHQAFLRTKKETRKTVLKEVKAQYRTEQPVSDILRQLRKGKATEATGRAGKKETRTQELSPERKRVLAALLTFVSAGSVDDVSRRSEAIDAIQALCGRQEPGVRKVHRLREMNEASRSPSPPPVIVACEDKSGEHDTFPVCCASTQCIFCMGDTELPTVQRTKKFRNRDGLKRHFFRKHLQHHAAGQRLQCPHPRCDSVWLDGPDHLRNHAETVHGTPT